MGDIGWDKITHSRMRESVWKLSGVIPTLNDERHVGALLSDLAAQTKRADEVLVVDAGSTDGRGVSLGSTLGGGAKRLCLPVRGRGC